MMQQKNFLEQKKLQAFSRVYGSRKRLAPACTALFRALKVLLPETQFQVLWMREIDGLSNKEIAGRLSISPSSVSRRLLRARATVRQALEQEQMEGENWMQPFIDSQSAARPG